MQALLSVIKSEKEKMTKSFSLNEDGSLKKGAFSQPSEFSLTNIKAADTASACVIQLEDLIKEDYGFCLGYHQLDTDCAGIEIDIVSKWKFDELRYSGQGFLHDKKHNILTKLFSKPTATRTKLLSKNRSQSSFKDFTNMQNARVLAFDIDVHDHIQYNAVETRAMSSVDNYVEWLHEVFPEMNFNTASFLATVSTSAKVRKDDEPELSFAELSKRGMHIYFVLDENAAGYEHKKFEETVKARLLSAGLMRPIPRKHAFSDKINAGIALTADEEAVFGLPNGTIFVTAEILDTAIPNDINRLLFEADPVLPNGWSTHADRYYRKDGGFVTFAGLPYESIRDKDKALVKATFRQEILNRQWFKLDNTPYSQEEVVAHINNTAFKVVDSELNYTLELSDKLVLEKVLDKQQPQKFNWSVQEVYEFLNESPCHADISCAYTEMPGRTIKLQTTGSDFHLFIPRMKMYVKLSAHSESILFKDKVVDHFTNKEAIDDTGNAYNLNLIKAINEGQTNIVSKALHSTGKTHSMLAMASKAGVFSVVVAPLRALVSDLVAKFEENGLKLLDYRKLDSFSGDISDYHGIAVCAPSIHRVWRFVEQSKNSLCLLVDEVESILRSIHSEPSLDSEIIYKEPDVTLFTLQSLLLHSKSFLLADADVGAATYDFMATCPKDYVIHRNNTQKKLSADGTPAPAYIHRFTKEGWPKCVADIAVMIEKNRAAGKKTIICSALKRSLTDVFSKINCNKVALVASRDTKKDSEETIRLIKEGDRFLENPKVRLADYDVIGLSPRATNGLDITLKDDMGEELPAELIYIHDRVLNYTHEVCIQHILRLRGANPVHLWLSDYFEPTEYNVDELAVSASYKACAAVNNIDVLGMGLNGIATPTAKYNQMRNDDSLEFSQRLFGYLSRVGFELKTQEDCIDSSSENNDSIQYMWEGKDAQLKWNNEILTDIRSKYSNQEYHSVMASYFYQNIIHGETKGYAPFDSFQVFMIDETLLKYADEKLGEVKLAECIKEVRKISVDIGYKISKKGYRIDETNEVPVIDFITTEIGDVRKYMRRICSALGYDVKRINTRTAIVGMSHEENATLADKGQVKLLSITKVPQPRISCTPVYCYKTGEREHVDDIGVDDDFLQDWLGYENSLKGLVIERALIDPVKY